MVTCRLGHRVNRMMVKVTCPSTLAWLLALPPSPLYRAVYMPESNKALAEALARECLADAVFEDVQYLWEPVARLRGRMRAQLSQKELADVAAQALLMLVQRDLIYLFESVPGRPDLSWDDPACRLSPSQAMDEIKSDWWRKPKLPPRSTDILWAPTEKGIAEAKAAVHRIDADRD